MKHHLALFLTAIFLVIGVGCSKSGSSANADVDHYTCTMHPSVKAKDPGKCPLCGMDLVPVMKKDTQAGAAAGAASSGPTEFTVPVERQQQIGVTYATVEMRSLSRTIRAVGFVVPDQKRNWSYVTRVDGYVQQLFVTSPGEVVGKGAPLLSVYSPDLLTSERELAMLLTSRRNGKASDATDQLIDAAKLRLRQWNVTDDQIAELEKGGSPSETLTLYSPFRGIVSKVSATQGAAIKAGDALVEVTDLSQVWVWVDFYETEIGLLRQGQTVSVTSMSYPGKVFDGTVSLLDPFVDPIKRTARVRIDVGNPGFLLRPGMYVSADLRLDPVTALSVPVDAVMPTGARNLVFVSKGEGRLEPRFVTLGGKFGDFYAVQKGLVAGERVVNSANFLIDAESKVQGAIKDFDDDEMPSDGENAAAVTADITPVVQTYLAIHDLLSKDNFQGVAALADELRREVSNLGDDGNALREAADSFKPANIKEARVGFGRLSASLLETLKKVPATRTLYVMRCPMWDSSPSEWIQVSKEVQNPFLGQAMATCGENVRVLGQ